MQSLVWHFSSFSSVQQLSITTCNYSCIISLTAARIIPVRLGASWKPNSGREVQKKKLCCHTRPFQTNVVPILWLLPLLWGSLCLARPQLHDSHSPTEQQLHTKHKFVCVHVAPLQKHCAFGWCLEMKKSGNLGPILPVTALNMISLIIIKKENKRNQMQSKRTAQKTW